MKEKVVYTEAFREQALEKVYSRGNRTVLAVADELHLSPWTLKNWMKAVKKKPSSNTGVCSKRPHDRSRAERLQLLLNSHALKDEALNAFCREQGVFPHQLHHWKADFEAETVSEHPAQLRTLKAEKTQLERELQRKDKALAEAAALLVLQKKYQALWEEKDG